jgi:hypothetical protein
MGKKKNIFVQLWEWLLDHGLLNAAIILNLIGVIILGMSMAFLKWLMGRQ